MATEPISGGGSPVWLRASCACGWEVTGPEDEVVTATMDHGQRVHNMPASREAVLEAAQRVPTPDEVSVPDAPG